jgi:hypothetical protein
LREKTGRKAAIIQATEGIASIWSTLPDSAPPVSAESRESSTS